jgi:hypothetical protein
MKRALVPLSGVVFFVTLLSSRLLAKSAPGSKASGARLLALYGSKHNLMVASATLVIIAAAVGVVFFGVLRDYLRCHERVRGAAATGFGGALIFLSGALVVGGATLALTDQTSHLAPAAAQTLNLIRWDVQRALLAGGAAVMLFSFGLAIVKSSLLPRWLGWLAFPLAIAALIPALSTLIAAATALWALGASIAMYLRSSATDDDAIRPTEEPVAPSPTG